MKVLLVEDDLHTASNIKEFLTNHNFLVDTADNGRAGLELAEVFPYDLILLDIMLPGLDGLNVCRQLRDRGDSTPILILTGKDSSKDCASGLEAGADDYLTKPFAWSELLARLHALLRRGQDFSGQVLTWGDLRLDIFSHNVAWGGKLLHLTPKEYGLLELFLRNPQRIFSRQAILDRVWDLDKIPGEEAVTTQIKGLRQKLKAAGIEGEAIETVYGFGYRLKKEEPGRPPEKETQEVPNLVSLTQAERQAKAAVSRLWETFKGDLLGEVEKLAQVSSRLSEGSLLPSQQQEAAAVAHRLVGALGSYGWAQGSEVARQIERLLQAQGSLSGERLSELVASLRQALERESSESSISPVPFHPWLLLVGVEAKLAEQIATVAVRRNWQATSASNLGDARQVIEPCIPDALVLDLDLAGTKEAGLTFLKELAADHPELPFFVLSEQDDLQQRLDVTRLGGEAFFHKPLNANRLLQRLACTLQQNREIDATLLAVDDDPPVLALLTEILEPWGFEVISLSDCQQFWRVLEETLPDLLILDVEMPQFSGLDLCQVVRNDDRFSSLPILFLSAHQDSQTVRQVFAAGADDYVAKPIVAEELVARVLNRLERVRGRLGRILLDYPVPT